MTDKAEKLRPDDTSGRRLALARAIDLKAQTKPGLKNLLENAKRLGRDDLAAEVLRELTLRGGVKAAEYHLLRWNQEAVRTALAPFVEVSKAVPDNERTTYTEAGGRKIGRSRADPDWMWVDSYTAIKTPKLNAIFVAYIPRPGDDVYFEVQRDRTVNRRFEADQLDAALVHWGELAGEAKG